MRSLLRPIGVSIPIVWFILLFIAGAMRPGYDHVRQYMTELTNGTTETLVVADLVIVGALWLVFAVGLWTALDRGALALLICAFVAVKGLATVGTGLIHGDVDPLVRTASGQTHNTLVAVGNVALALACLLALRSRTLARVRTYNAVTAALLVVLIVALATLTTAGTGRADAPLAAVGGLVQRLSMLVANLWPAVIAFVL